MMLATESREADCEVSVILTEATIPILIEGTLTNECKGGNIP